MQENIVTAPLRADRTFIRDNSSRAGQGMDCPLLSDNIDDYPGGIIIPVDKPYRWTSADVVRKIKFAAVRHFHKKNLKVGHAGTLDPLATGVLLICIGKATKMAEELQNHDKEYIAGITFGATTPSYDLEKEIDRMFPSGHITEESLAEALKGFIGEQEQVAPLFSAKSVDGVRAYELARKLYRQHKPLDAAAAELIRTSTINISDISLIEFRPGGRPCGNANAGDSPEDGRPCGNDITGDSPENSRNLRINVTDNSHLSLPEAIVRIECSKGTYVRAFARDLGEALGSGAHLSSLQRSRSGDFRIEEAISMEEAAGLFTGRHKEL